MEVRPLAWSDFDSWVELYYTRYAEIESNPELGVLLEPSRPSIGREIEYFASLHRATAEGTSFCSVAVEGSHVLGVCEVHRKGGHVEDRHVGVLGIAVHPDHRGRGIGTALVGDVLAACRGTFEMVLLEVFEGNERARRLYERLTFEVYGRLPNGAKRGDRYFAEIHMWKRLDAAAEG